MELSGASDLHQVAISIGRLGRLLEEIHDRGAIEPRSQCDRAAIVAPSSRNQRHDHQTMFIRELRSRSTHDRGLIAARSWPDRGSFQVKSWLIQRQSGNHDQCQGNRSHDPCNPLPRPHQSARFLGQISL